jgi:hypothetical protein
MDKNVRKIYKRRLNHLQQRVAYQGIYTPPEVLMEIEDIKRLLKKYIGD